MLDTKAQITGRREIVDGLLILRFRSPSIARSTAAGQFVNVLPPSIGSDPILRRPFSVYGIDGDEAEIIIQVVGKGTSILAQSKIGDVLDVLGPLGNPWKIESGSFETAVLVIGGVGVASMPLLTKALKQRTIPTYSYYGARTASYLVRAGLEGLHIATDDGSEGFRGTNIDLLGEHLKEGRYTKPKLFVCGPTGMMRAAKRLAQEFSIPCEVSLETEMACGIGICQGCPVITDEATFAKTGKRFRLVCTEGPSFMSDAIQF